MRIDYIKLAGFRGFREFTHVEVPSGFLVLTGRNGTGKSTILDAIEFVLTGTIEKYRTESAGKERLSDYIWWRGSAEDYFVELGLVSDEGRSFKLRRSRNDKPSSFATVDAENVLCDRGSAPAESLRHLCRTTIIRDEQIAALSWDQTDTARFELVKAAVGALAPTDVAKQLAAASTVAEAARDQLSHEADIVATRHRTLVADVSEARLEAQRSGDIAAALEELRQFTGHRTDNISELLTVGRRIIAERRTALQTTRLVAQQLREYERLQSEVAREEYRTRAARTANTEQAAQDAYDEAAAQLRRLQEQVRAAERVDERAAALAALADYGERLGLEDGRCPLCHARHTEAEYRRRIASLREQITAMAAPLLELRSGLGTAKALEASTRQILEEARARRAEVRAVENTLRETQERLLSTLRRANETITELPSADEADRHATAEDRQLTIYEEAAFVLEASQSVDRISRLEALAATAQAEAEKASIRVGTAARAMSALTQAEHEAKRVAGEIVDARLAAISPLLSELYYRLRPHRRWREIDYQIRGDVRRFLTLTVGDGVNPQFVFSSGERRAAGLAFLLAVSLSRPWCKLKTLAFDDPIQHIDDFRALHLVEVLSAIRKQDRQIVCAVEDEQVADLLCRRLRSTPSSPGGRIDLDWGADSGARVESQKLIRPLPLEAVVRAAS